MEALVFFSLSLIYSTLLITRRKKQKEPLSKPEPAPQHPVKKEEPTPKESPQIIAQLVEKTEFEEKIKDLETKLNEYHVLEKDISELKEVQQQNIELKALLAKNGITSP